MHRGSLEDLESLKSGAAKSDAVIHLAFIHDFSKFQENCETDRRAIEALGSALAGSDRLLIATSGTLLVAPGRLATEEDAPTGTIPRLTTEEEAAALAGPGVRICVVRLPQVHDQNKQGLVTYLIDIAREKSVSAFVGDGMNRWSAAHLSIRPSLPARAGEGFSGLLSRGLPKRVCPCAISLGDRSASETAGRRENPGGGRGAFRIDGRLRGSRWSRFQRADARAARMAPGWPWTNRGS